MEKNKFLQQTIATNLVYYRKLMNLTQSQLAQKLNYSDKAISKWERGEGTPDVFVLKEIADIYHITLNDLISDEKKKVAPSYRRNKILVTSISCVFVWIVAVLIQVVLSWTLKKPTFPIWMVYVYGIPVTFIILVVFSCIWFKKIYRLIAISGLIWTICLSIFLTFYFINIIPSYEYMVFLLGIPVQVGFILWFFLKRKKKEDKIDNFTAN